MYTLCSLLWTYLKICAFFYTMVGISFPIYRKPSNNCIIWDQNQRISIGSMLQNLWVFHYVSKYMQFQIILGKTSKTMISNDINPLAYIVFLWISLEITPNFFKTNETAKQISYEMIAIDLEETMSMIKPAHILFRLHILLPHLHIFILYHSS